MRYFNVMILGPTQSPYEGWCLILSFRMGNGWQRLSAYD